MSVCSACAANLPDSARFCPNCGAAAEVAAGSDGTAATDVVRLRLQEAVQTEFLLQVELGRGSMGVAYLAKQLKLDRLVVLKALLQNPNSSHDLSGRFRQEARTQSRLLHPHIVPILDVREAADLMFLVMPYIDGPNLRQVLQLEPQPPIDHVERMLREIGDALAFAHRTGVIHRDVKPENILVDRATGGMFLADFGIAKMMAPDETALTLNFTQLGTPRYMAPEQWENAFRIDGRSDQYGLGLIGWEMLAGRPPYDARTTIELYNQQKTSAPEDLAAVRPEAPAALRDAIMRAIQKNREDRFPTMEAFLATLTSPSYASVTSTALPGTLPRKMEPTLIEPPPQVDDAMREAAPATSMPTPPAMAALPASPAPARSSSRAWWIAPLLGLAVLGAAWYFYRPAAEPTTVEVGARQTPAEPIPDLASKIPAENRPAPKPKPDPARTIEESSPPPAPITPPVQERATPQPQRNLPANPGGPNSKPFATFSYSPKRGNLSTTFRLDASGSHDDRDAANRLEVRWDFDNDGDWDTPFSTNKVTTVRYDKTGKRLSRVQVRDSAGQTAIFLDGPTVAPR